jgi:hypothetical protein
MRTLAVVVIAAATITTVTEIATAIAIAIADTVLGPAKNVLASTPCARRFALAWVVAAVGAVVGDWDPAWGLALALALDLAFGNFQRRCGAAGHQVVGKSVRVHLGGRTHVPPGPYLCRTSPSAGPFGGHTDGPFA